MTRKDSFGFGIGVKTYIINIQIKCMSRAAMEAKKESLDNIFTPQNKISIQQKQRIFLKILVISNQFYLKFETKQISSFKNIFNEDYNPKLRLGKF